MLILVVDDEPCIAELVQAVAQERGHECILAFSMDEADAVLKMHNVDGVTLDLLMPGRGGLAWLEALAERNPALARRTVVVTGCDLNGAQAELIARCGAALVMKPFEVERLAEALDKQLTHGS